MLRSWEGLVEMAIFVGLRVSISDMFTRNELDSRRNDGSLTWESSYILCLCHVRNLKSWMYTVPVPATLMICGGVAVYVDRFLKQSSCNVLAVSRFLTFSMP